LLDSPHLALHGLGGRIRIHFTSSLSQIQGQ
jgi:hypothetical protein